MPKKAICIWFFFTLLLFILLAPSQALTKKKGEIVGREILNFTLPSSQDRLITYADEYYGKYFLVMTFFPAAFTPI